MDKNSKFSVKRRAALKKSLKGAVATGIVSASNGWSRPVVESIVVPAHATTTGCEISITNITINENTGQLFSINNPTSGSNLGDVTVDNGDNGEMNANGVVMPPPPPGTMVQISATALQNNLDNAIDNCFFADLNSGPCVIEVPVNSTNGDFSLSGATINGLDDNCETDATLRFAIIDCPAFVIDFTLVYEASC